MVLQRELAITFNILKVELQTFFISVNILIIYLGLIDESVEKHWFTLQQLCFALNLVADSYDESTFLSLKV